MNGTILLDSDILIDLAHNRSAAVSFISELESQAILAVSVISQMELLIGCRNKIEMGRMDRFLRGFRILQVSEDISEDALDLLRRYRMSHGLAIADALIAATALVLEIPLLTRNRRHFQHVKDLRLLEAYQ